MEAIDDLKTVAVLYATREGQAKRIAEFIAGDLRAIGFVARLRNVAEATPDVLGGCCAAILTASIHIGRHEREMVRFVRSHRAELERIPTAFLSVSLSQRGVEDPLRTPAQRAQAASDVRHVLDTFTKATKWTPTHIRPVAGALLYTKYNPLIRFVMKQISKRAGGATDTSRDYDYTDWAQIRDFTSKFAAEVANTSSLAGADAVCPVVRPKAPLYS